MAHDINTMVYDLVRYNSEHATLRKLFLALANAIISSNQVPQRSSFDSINPLITAESFLDETKDTLKVVFMSRSYFLHFRSVLAGPPQNVQLLGKITVNRKFCFEQDDLEGTEIADFCFDVSGYLTGIDLVSTRSLTNNMQFQNLVIEIIHNDLMFDVKQVK